MVINTWPPHYKRHESTREWARRPVLPQIPIDCVKPSVAIGNVCIASIIQEGMVLVII